MERPQENPLKFRPDVIDAALLANRQRLVIEMILRGQVSGSDGMFMYNETSSLDTARREREAMEAGRLGEYDTPSGHLATLLFKLRPGNFSLDNDPKEEEIDSTGDDSLIDPTD